MDVFSDIEGDFPLKSETWIQPWASKMIDALSPKQMDEIFHMIFSTVVECQ